MADDNRQRCAGPSCHRVIEVKPTGRPALYCGDNCRQAARRGRVREIEAARQLAERLAAAQATMQRLFRPLEETYREVAELAGEVFGTAADPGRDPDALGKVLAEFAWAAERLQRYALDYQDADNQARTLAQVKAASEHP